MPMSPFQKPLYFFQKNSNRPGHSRRLNGLFAHLTCGIIFIGVAHANAKTSIFDLPIDQLLQIKVTTVARKSQAISDTPAAVYVITQEMIARSAAQNIPDLLRMVPGLQVARIDANKWSISSRGFGGQFSNKLLVLMDGRTIYTSFFSGVFWDQQDVILKDIDRIEVIRGPGGSVWGANAVNGIINIITKSSKDTQGGYLNVTLGTEKTGAGAFRFGDKIGEHTFFRIYGKYFTRGEGELSTGGEASDNWDIGHVGFRMDSKINSQDSLSIRGTIGASKTGQTYTLPALTPPYSTINEESSDNSNGFLSLEWNRRLPNGTKYKVQSYYDHVSRDDPRIKIQTDTFDIDFQNQFKFGDSHEIVWGAGYRLIVDESSGSPFLSFTPENKTFDRFSLFVQDEISLIKNELWTSIGAKLEHNDFTGFEFQPSLRATWKIDPNQTAWGAVSRAVRTPDRGSDGVNIKQFAIPPSVPPNPSPTVPAVVATFGSSDFKSEEVVSYELGYRSQITESISADITAFYNVYDKLTGGIAGTPFFEPALGGPNVVLPIIAQNNVTGETYGVELAADWRINDWFRLYGSYSFLDLQLHADPGATAGSEVAEGDSPHHQVKIRSAFNLSSDTSLDVYLRYVDALGGLGIDDYLALDIRFGWKPMANVEFAVIGRNLLGAGQTEYSESRLPTLSTETERALSAMIQVTF